jgi:hypothetical protein
VRYRIRRSVGVIGRGQPGMGGPITDQLTGNITGVGQVALGFIVLAGGALLLFSTTSAGQLVGQGVQRSARTALAVIPQTRALAALS